jgi:chaperonin GroEL
MTNAIVKDLSFGNDARSKIFKGIEKLTKAVSSTLGAHGRAVIMEDNTGKPIITKDGVTVANDILLYDPVENMGATLIKEAARKTVTEAGDGTTTATVLTHAILEEAYKLKNKTSRELNNGINSAVEKVIKYLDDNSIDVKGDMLDQVATVSANNDSFVGEVIAEAFRSVDKTGVVMMETSEDGVTQAGLVEGVQYEKGISNLHFITNKASKTVELDNPAVLLIDSPVDSIRQIQNVIEIVHRQNKSLLIIGDLDSKVVSILAMNKINQNLKINVIEAPTFGINRKSTFDDLALITGATVISEDLGDDLDLITLDHLGSCLKSVTSQLETVIRVGDVSDDVKDVVDSIKEQLSKNNKASEVIKLEKRLAMMSTKLAVVKVGANSEVELKEKLDRVEDAICATKAAIKEGIVPGGGVALLNASTRITPKNAGEELLLKAIKKPYLTILENATIDNSVEIKGKGKGLNVVTGKMVNMVKEGIIDPLLVTKSALKNAASVATTILSTNCVINNVRA